jgi:uncharacterized RDD family membrane protein YckC
VSDTGDRDDTFDWSAPGPPEPGPGQPAAGQPPAGQPPTPPAPEPWGQPAAPAGGGQQWGQPAVPPGGGQPGYGYAPAQGDPGWAGAAAAGPPYAHWGLRVASFLIDWLIPTVAFVVLIFVGGAISAASGNDSDAGLGIFIALAYLALIGFWVWNSCLRQGRTGRSVGKSVVGTALVRATDGTYVGGGLAFLRELAHVLDGLPCYLGYLWPLWDDKRQTFSDKVCGTVVVRTR